MDKQQVGKIIGWIASGIVLAGVIGAIIFVVLVVWRQSDSGEETGHVSGRTYSLSEWSATVDVPQKLQDEIGRISVGYYKDPGTGTDAYYLVSQELADAEFLCTQDKSFETNGAFLMLERSYKQPPSVDVKTKQVDEYHYWVDDAPFQGQCYNDGLMSKYFGVDTKSVLESIHAQ